MNGNRFRLRIKTWAAQADDVLRGQPTGQPWGLVVICGMAYGAAMGTFGGVSGDRIWQTAYSAAKVPMLLAATVALSLPSFFVINTLAGLRADFAAAARGVVASQAGLAVILVSLAPLTLFWYATSENYSHAILFNALMFAVAAFGAQTLLRRSYAPLIARDPRHRRLLRTWIAIYAFVGIQLSWTLRPFVGSPNAPARFFRGGDFENAYVIVAEMIWEAVTGAGGWRPPTP